MMPYYVSIFVNIFSFIEFQYVVLMELQTIKDSQKANLERIDVIDGGDGEYNAQPWMK